MTSQRKTFLSDLVVIQSGSKFWSVVKNLVYVTWDGLTITVPAGYKTDGASIPYLFQWLLPRWDTYRRAVVLHDFLYDNHVSLNLTRAQCDLILKQAMTDDNVSAWKQKLICMGVRIGGGSHFGMMLKRTVSVKKTTLYSRSFWSAATAIVTAILMRLHMLDSDDGKLVLQIIAALACIFIRDAITKDAK